MDYMGLNVNDYWTLRSGLIGDAVPRLAEQARREEAAERAERRRLNAELRLQERVQSPALSKESNARSAALLCAALGEARRLGHGERFQRWPLKREGKRQRREPTGGD